MQWGSSEFLFAIRARSKRRRSDDVRKGLAPNAELEYPRLLSSHYIGAAAIRRNNSRRQHNFTRESSAIRGDKNGRGPAAWIKTRESSKEYVPSQIRHSGFIRG